MRNIKNSTSVSSFDDFLCKLEEKEELGCFVVSCGHGTEHEQNDKPQGNDCFIHSSGYDTNDEQNDKHESSASHHGWSMWGMFEKFIVAVMFLLIIAVLLLPIIVILSLLIIVVSLLRRCIKFFKSSKDGKT